MIPFQSQSSKGQAYATSSSAWRTTAALRSNTLLRSSTKRTQRYAVAAPCARTAGVARDARAHSSLASWFDMVLVEYPINSFLSSFFSPSLFSFSSS